MQPLYVRKSEDEGDNIVHYKIGKNFPKMLQIQPNSSLSFDLGYDHCLEHIEIEFSPGR